MKEILYIEVPTPDSTKVFKWLHDKWTPEGWHKINTTNGIRLQLNNDSVKSPKSTTDHNDIPDKSEISIFGWSLQRTTYLKVFRYGKISFFKESYLLQQFVKNLRKTFPQIYPALPQLDQEQQSSIFTALLPYYPQTVKYFQKMPQGELDLQRVYWWEKQWRQSSSHPKTPKQVIFHQTTKAPNPQPPNYDLIYIGGALGIIHAAVMARLGYKVLLIERLSFGRMNREWNISRDEFQSLINLGLFTPNEFETIIACEYQDGFHKFFDGNNPNHLKAKILHTPHVLNIAIDSEKLLKLCGDKFKKAGGTIWDETEFNYATIYNDQVILEATYRPCNQKKQATGRLIIDAMGTASPIAWQINQGRPFDSVCPTVGAVLTGISPAVWDSRFGDVLNSHGDISRSRQLIWELFPASGKDLTIYLFHYHEIHPDNPGSLLELYEDFFTILPEYRRCDLDQLTWKKPTFGYIPGYFSTWSGDRQVGYNRLLAIGDAASLQSPLVFTGFGSLVRNLNRLTTLLDTALKHDLLQAKHLNQIRAYQSNIAVTWLFSKAMMVPTNMTLPPARINSMLNTFFGLLANEPPQIAENFIKDRIDWLTFNKLALKAAWLNTPLIYWTWEMAGTKDLFRWVISYLDYTRHALINLLLGAWFPNLVTKLQPWIEPRYPSLWLWLLVQSYFFAPNKKSNRTPPMQLQPLESCSNQN